MLVNSQPMRPLHHTGMSLERRWGIEPRFHVLCRHSPLHLGLGALVRMTGFEPAISTIRTWRISKLSHILLLSIESGYVESNHVRYLPRVPCITVTP